MNFSTTLQFIEMHLYINVNSKIRRKKTLEAVDQRAKSLKSILHLASYSHDGKKRTQGSSINVFFYSEIV